MSTIRRSMFLALLLIGVMAVLAPQHAFAVGTPSGTTINNRATVNYQVGAIAQTPIESKPGAGNSTPGAGNGADTTFLVDDKVIVTVANNDAGFVTTYPGANNQQALKFTVTNGGNTTHDFALYSGPVGTNTFAATSVTFYADTNGNGTFDPGTDLALPTSAGTAYLDELAASASKVVFLVVNVPATATNSQTANYVVWAEAHQGGLGGTLGALTKTQADLDKLIADNPATVQIVLADGAGNGNGIGGATDASYDGKYAQLGTNGFQISAPVLTITKNSAVYWDPVDITTNPKAIPGAIMTYTITIANAAGAATATSVSISDSLNAEITAGHLLFNAQFNDGTAGTNCNTPLYGIAVDPGDGTGQVCKTNSVDVDNADFSGNTVHVSGLSIAANKTATIKFQAIVQ
jgi:hypothetical protein